MTDETYETLRDKAHVLWSLADCLGIELRQEQQGERGFFQWRDTLASIREVLAEIDALSPADA